MQLIDIGANLTHSSFSNDFETVVRQAQDVGVAHIILTGTDAESSRQAAALAHNSPDYFSATAGFHPHVATQCDAAGLRELHELGQSAAVVAIGETGLDYNRNFSPAPVQVEVFARHLELAAALNKPVFLHQRDAHEDFLGVLREQRDALRGGVVHCFTDTEQALFDYLDLDMYIGITGWICDERRGKELQALVASIPEDRLLLETDAPYLLPRTLTPKPKSRRNEPRHLTAVLETVAHCCRRSPVNVAASTTANAMRLFGIKPTPPAATA